MLAVKAAARSIAHFPLPPGATRVHSLPPHAAYLRRLRALDEPVESALNRSRWWLVPLGYRHVIDWYIAHTPADRAETRYPSGRVATRAVLDWVTHNGSAAYSPPAQVVAYTRLGTHRTAIRTDVTLAARFDRTARTLAPDTVTSIRVTRQALDGPDAAPRTVSVTDPSQLSAVVSAFDRDRGWFQSPEPSGCGSPVGIVYIYAVTFYWPHHSLIADAGQPLCDIGRRLTRDGTAIPQTLDPNGALNSALKSVYDHP